MPFFFKYRYALILATVSLALPGNTAFGFTKSGTTYTTDGSQADVSAAIGNASAGDTVNIPAGSFTWGSGNTSLQVNKAIKLLGAGQSSTIITIAADAPSSTNGTIQISAAATVGRFAIVPASGRPPFSTSTSNGWRITDIGYNLAAASVSAYFCYIGNVYGLIDNCTINGGGGTNELIFSRGPTNSWQTPNSLGTVNALYVEDCAFGGVGYICDINDNGRAVIRFNNVTAQLKVDGHGYASNSLRGVRHLETYNNHWTAAASFWVTMELRGGTGMVFDNVCDNRGGVSVNYPTLYLTEYGSINLWPNFSSTYQTPTYYPVKDQIGVGQDPKVGGSEPYYLWNNIQAGADYPISFKPIPAAAISQYQTETGNPAATYTMEDIIKADRDYFKGTVGASFDGSSGVGRGTKAQMLAITPTKTGVGFWVTDEASWNTTLPANTSGQLYTWSGAAWVLKYTPYTYPHPLRRPDAPSNLQVIP